MMQHEVKITDKNFSYLQHLANAVQFAHHNLRINEHRDAIFYQLAIAGEIVVKKLPTNVQPLLPGNICGVLKNIRDNLLTHSGYTLAVFQMELFTTLRSHHHQQFGLLVSIINKIIIREVTSTICIKLRELTSLEDGRFSKANNLVKEIGNVFDRIQPALQALPPQDQARYTQIQQAFAMNYTTALAPIREAITHRVMTDVDIAKRADLLMTQIENLENISRQISTAEELPTEIPKFCHNFIHHFGVVAEKTKMIYTSPQVLQERKKEVNTWIKHYSQSLDSITKKLCGFDEQRLKNSARDLEVQITQYNARWHLIMLNALFEEAGSRSTTLFHRTKNSAIHQVSWVSRTVRSLRPNPPQNRTCRTTASGSR